MVAAIIGAEIGFWVLLLGGLIVRYVLKAQRPSTVILSSVPVVDLILVILVSIDIARGAEPTHAHALAAVYLGLSIAFGHQIVGRVDAWVNHRFAGGPKPLKAPKGSTTEVKEIWSEWLRVLTAAIIAAVCLCIMIAFDGWFIPSTLEAAGTHPYWGTMHIICIVTGIWFLAGPAFAGKGDPSLDHPVEQTRTR